MILDTIDDCCNFAFAALDGMYGWVSEAISIVIVVFAVNFLLKWFLKKLHFRYEKQKKVWKDSFVQALYLPLSYYVWFFALVQAVDLISSRVLVAMPAKNRHIVLTVGLILAFAWFLMRWKHNIVRHMMAKSKLREITIDQGKISGIDKVLTVVIAFFTTLFLLEATNQSVNTLIAFGGVGGLAIAFASQEVIANFFGGFMIYLTHPFTVGDWILLPDRSIEGHVEDIGWYMTRVRSFDKRPIYIPNSIFSKIIVVTPSRMSHRQIKETIGVSYNDMSKLKGTITAVTEMLRQHPEIDRNLPIIVRFSAFGEYSLDILLNVYTQITDTEGFLKVKEDVLFKIAAIFEKHGVEFASPTQIVTLSNPPVRQETGMERANPLNSTVC